MQFDTIFLFCKSSRHSFDRNRHSKLCFFGQIIKCTIASNIRPENSRRCSLISKSFQGKQQLIFQINDKHAREHITYTNACCIAMKWFSEFNLTLAIQFWNFNWKILRDFLSQFLCLSFRGYGMKWHKWKEWKERIKSNDVAKLFQKLMVKMVENLVILKFWHAIPNSFSSEPLQCAAITIYFEQFFIRQPKTNKVKKTFIWKSYFFRCPVNPSKGVDLFKNWFNASSKKYISFSLSPLEATERKEQIGCILKPKMNYSLRITVSAVRAISE